MTNQQPFTKQQVIDIAYNKYGKPVCTDSLDEAMLLPTLAEAVELVILDSAFWDGDLP